jgi:hypothetical protein
MQDPRVPIQALTGGQDPQAVSPSPGAEGGNGIPQPGSQESYMQLLQALLHIPFFQQLFSQITGRGSNQTPAGPPTAAPRGQPGASSGGSFSDKLRELQARQGG